MHQQQVGAHPASVTALANDADFQAIGMNETRRPGLALPAIRFTGYAIQHVPGGAGRQQARGAFQVVCQHVTEPLPAAGMCICIEVPVGRQGLLKSNRQGKGQVRDQPLNDRHVRFTGAICLIGQAQGRMLGEEAAAFVDGLGQAQVCAIAQMVKDHIGQPLEIPAAPLVGGGELDSG